jgi:hypothetical protein
LPDGRVAVRGWAVGQGTIVQEGKGVVRLETKTAPALLELLPSPPWERYRFEVEVQELGGARAAGIYLGYHRPLFDGRPEHWFCAFSYVEQTRWSPKKRAKTPFAQATVNLRRYGVESDRPGLPGRPFDNRRFVSGPRQFLVHPGSWRRLAVEVTPEMISFFWDRDKTPCSFVPRATTMERYRQRLALLGPKRTSPPPMPGRGGVGLLCESGAARFRAPVIRPLPGR